MGYRVRGLGVPRNGSTRRILTPQMLWRAPWMRSPPQVIFSFVQGLFGQIFLQQFCCGGCEWAWKGFTMYMSCDPPCIIYKYI